MANPTARALDGCVVTLEGIGVTREAGAAGDLALRRAVAAPVPPGGAVAADFVLRPFLPGPRILACLVEAPGLPAVYAWVPFEVSE